MRLFRKKLIISYLVFIFLITGLLGLFILDRLSDDFPVKGIIIIVDINGNGNYTKIQDAIDNASADDTIYVWAGIYNENIIINKKLTLKGNGSTNTSIIGGGTGDVVNITADYVHFSNFSVKNSGIEWEEFDYTAGIQIYSSDYCVIENCSCLNNFQGINLRKSNYNIIKNNICTHNTKMSIQNDQNSGICVFYDSQYNIITNNSCTSNSTQNGIGIKIDGTPWYHPCRFNKIKNNTCINNNIGIYISWECTNLIIINNNCSKNKYGIVLDSNCSNNRIINNTCIHNDDIGISLDHSSNCDIINNNCSIQNSDGIYLAYSSNNNLINNTCSDNNNDGIDIRLDSKINHLNNNICNDNYFNGLRIEAFSNTFKNNTCINNNNGIYIGYSNYNVMTNSNFTNNNASVYLENTLHNTISQTTCYGGRYGFYIIGAPGNTIDNCTFSSHSNSDIYLRYSGKNNTAINTTLNSVFHYDSSDELIVKNYLHIYVNDTQGLPILGVDVRVLDNSIDVYASSGFGGTDPKTDPSGQVKWILMTDKILNKTGDKNNITEITIKHPSYTFWNNHRQVDMGMSHFEYFSLNTEPNKTILNSPNNNSSINDNTPTLTWSASTDNESDPLTYFIEVDEFGGDWSTYVGYNHTDVGILTWDIPSSIPDGSYQWRVRANDSLENGTWSDIWKFTIDTGIPEANKPNCHCIFNNTGTVTWAWQPSSDTGSGIDGYFIYIGTAPNINDVIDGAWTTNNWYQRSGLNDGTTYYCRIKAKNTAGSVSSYSLSSNGVLIDLDTPNPNQPVIPSLYNNTGEVKWTWQKSTDTGSGIVGYYVYIGTTSDGSDVVNGEWTTDTWYSQSGLIDSNTYYCRIKAENGAGTVSDYSTSSVGILIDLDSPIANTPTTTIKYNNTGKVIWYWQPSVDTGSGILGYYVCIGTTEDGCDIANDIWITDTWSEHKGLIENVYYCKIKVKNGAGTIGEYSSSSIDIIVDLTDPGTPDKLKADPGTWTAINSFNLSWTNPNDFSGIAGVYYKLGEAPGSNNDGTYISNQDIFKLTEISVQSDGEHEIYIWLKDLAGNVNFKDNAYTSFYLDTEAPSAPISITVTPYYWSSQKSFSIDWSLPIDLSGIKTGAYYFIGAEAPSSQTVGTWTNDKPINIKDVSEGVTKVHLWLEDIAGNRDFRNYGIAILKYDRSKPTIVHTKMTTGTEGKEITINADVEDEHAGVAQVLLYFKSPLDSNYSKLEMNLKPGTSTYSTEIPANKVTIDDLEYYLKAIDNSKPENHIYFGYNEETNLEPDSDTDIDINIPLIPEVTGKSPKGTYISIKSFVNISFNKPMDKKATEDGFSISPIVNGTFDWENNKLIFSPSELLVYQTKYTVTISKEVEDEEGLNLVDKVTFSFTTEPEPEVEEPKKKEEDGDQTSMIILVMIIIIIVVLLILFMVMRKKKKDEEQRKKEEEKRKAKLAAQKPKIELIISDQSHKGAFNCQNCGAIIPEPDRCMYCGWTRQM